MRAPGASAYKVHPHSTLPGVAGKKHIVRLVALTAALCCATAALDGCRGDNINFGPSGAQVAGILIGGAAAVAVGTIAVVEVHKSHHNIRGCVSSGSNGLELQTQDGSKTYALTGATSDIKTGDQVRLHGNKLKRPKHSTGTQTFEVTQVSKDYGPCKLAPAAAKTVTP